LEVGVEGYGFIGGEGDCGGLIGVADGAGGGGWGVEGGGGEFVVGPGEVDLDVAAGAEALDGTGGPCVGKCGEELEGVGLGLEEHFGDGGGVAEVAINLEWGMGAEEVGVDAAAVDHVFGGVSGNEVDEIVEEFVGVFGVEEAGPADGAPGHGPAGGFIASGGEGNFGGGGEVWCCEGGNLVAGVEGEEV